METRVGSHHYYSWVDRLSRGLIIPITIRVVIDEFRESQILFFPCQIMLWKRLWIYFLFFLQETRVFHLNFLILRGVCPLGDCYLSGFYPFEG